MKCVYCSGDTKVINSRLNKRANHIWRRRSCLECKAVFTTDESPDFFKSLVVKKAKAVEAFNRDKLFISIYDSLKHRKTAHNDATGLTNTVISKLYPLIDSGSIGQSDITKATQSVLKHFDKVALTHYSAFHLL